MLLTPVSLERFVTLLIRSLLVPRAKATEGFLSDRCPGTSLTVLEDDSELEELRLRFTGWPGGDSMIHWAKKEGGDVMAKEIERKESLQDLF